MFSQSPLSAEELKLDRSKQFLYGKQFCGAVDNFQTYLQELYVSILFSYPLLNGNSQMDAQTVFKHADMSALKLSFAKSGARNLSQKSIHQQSEDVQRRWKFALFPNSKITDEVVQIVEIRNTITHSRGEMQSQFCKSPIVFHGAEVSDVLKLLTDLVFDIDKRAAEKWHSLSAQPKH